MHKPCIVPYFSSILISRIFISLSHHTALKISKYNFLYPIVLGKTQVGFCFIYASFPANPFRVFFFGLCLAKKAVSARRSFWHQVLLSFQFVIQFRHFVNSIKRLLFSFVSWNKTSKKCHKRNQIKKKLFLWNYPLFWELDSVMRFQNFYLNKVTNNTLKEVLAQIHFLMCAQFPPNLANYTNIQRWGLI